MAGSQVTPPPGYQLEPAPITPPAGYELESAPTQPTVRSEPATRPDPLQGTLTQGGPRTIGERLGAAVRPFAQHLQMGGAAPDERLLAPEAAMTPGEQQAHPIVAGTADVAGGLTTGGNLALVGATGGLGTLPGAAGKVVPRIASGLFSYEQIRGAIAEFPDFRDAVAQKDFGRAERVATHMAWGFLLGARSGNDALRSGSIFAEAKNRSDQVNQVQKQAVGLYSDIQNQLKIHEAALQAQGLNAISGALQQDAAALRSSGARGAIPLAAIADQIWRGVEDRKAVGRMSTADNSMLSELRMDNSISLERAKDLRTKWGYAMAKARDPYALAYYTDGYKLLGEGMRQRIADLEHKDTSFNTYNDRYKSAFELHKGVTGDMMEPALGQDPTDIIKKLDNFAKERHGVQQIADNQMRPKTMNRPEAAKALEQSQKDSKIMADAHELYSANYIKSAIRMFASNYRETWPGIAVLAASYGMGLHGILPWLAGTVAAGAALRHATEGKVSGIAGRLEGLPEESFQTRTPVRGAEESTKMESKAAPWPQGREQVMPKSPAKVRSVPTTPRGAEPDIEMQMRGATGEEPAKPKGTKMSWEDWQKARQAEEIQARRGAKKADMEKQLKEDKQIAGTAKGAKLDTSYIKQAKDELGKDAKTQQIIVRAQELKDKAKPKLNLGKGHPGMDE